jgi:hypothetical protein
MFQRKESYKVVDKCVMNDKSCGQVMVWALFQIDKGQQLVNESLWFNSKG